MIKLIKSFCKKIAMKFIGDYRYKTILVKEQALELGKARGELAWFRAEASKLGFHGDRYGSFYKAFSPFNSIEDQIAIHKRLIKLIDGLEDSKSVAIATHFFHVCAMVASTSENKIKISKDGLFLPEIFYEKTWLRDEPIVSSLRAKYSIKSNYIVETVGLAPNFYGLGSLPVGITDQIKGKTIIDAGANSGETAFLFEDNFKPDLIYSFEPDRNTFVDLCEIIKRNEKEDIIKPYQLALSDSEGSVTFYASANEPGGSSLIHQRNFYEDKSIETYSVRTQTLDSFISEHPEAPAIGFIKADVEGAALLLVKGAVETLKKDRPILILAIYHSTQEFFEVKPFIESLGLGYKFMIRKSLLHLSATGETLLIAYCDK